MSLIYQNETEMFAHLSYSPTRRPRANLGQMLLPDDVTHDFSMSLCSRLNELLRGFTLELTFHFSDMINMTLEFSALDSMDKRSRDLHATKVSYYSLI